MILITGASGLIGRALAFYFCERLQSVRLQYHAQEHFDAAGVEENGRLVRLAQLRADAVSVEPVCFDFASAQPSDFERLVAGCSTVIHCAGLVHEPTAPDELYKALNVRATVLLAQACKAAGVGAFVFLSTSAVYGNGPFVDITEDAPVSPVTPYAVSKAAGEELLQREPPSPQVIILRPSLVFGEGDRGNMLALIRQIKRGLYFDIAGNSAKKSVVYSRDVARAIGKCLEVCPQGCSLFNLANPEPVGVNVLSQTIAGVLQRPAPPAVPRALVQSGAAVAELLLGSRSPVTRGKIEKLMTSTTLSVERLVKATGFSPQFSLAQALLREVAWMNARA